MPLKINGSSSGYTEIKAADAAANNTLTLPSASGSLMTTGGSNTFTSNQIIEVTDNTNAALRITQLGTGDAIRVEDSTNPDSTPFVVDASGNVGVGTGSPAYRLDVSTTGTSIASALRTDQTEAYLALKDSGTTIGNVRLGSSSNAMLMLAGGSERMRINSAGRIVIGSSSEFNNYSRLQIVGSGEEQLAIRHTSATAGRFWRFTSDPNNTVYIINQDTAGVYIGNGGTSWSSLSDERTKDIIEPITDAATKVSSLRAVIGKYKTDEEGKRRSFLIAQDVEAVLPEAVSIANQETGYLGLSYTEVIPLLVAAIKEQQQEISDLKTRLTAIEGGAA